MNDILSFNIFNNLKTFIMKKYNNKIFQKFKNYETIENFKFNNFSLNFSFFLIFSNQNIENFILYKKTFMMKKYFNQKFFQKRL